MSLLGPIFRFLEAFLGISWTFGGFLEIFGGFWASFKPLGAVLGVSLGQVLSFLGPFLGFLAPFCEFLGAFLGCFGVFESFKAFFGVS